MEAIMIKLAEPYEPRPIHCLDVWEHAGWRLKLYSIACNRPTARAALVDAAQAAARERLPQPAVTPDRYGVGFLGVHDGRGVNFVFVDWWADENELHHHVYISPVDQPDRLEYRTSGSIACVWDLRVMAFERQAWIDTVLANPAGPDLDAYLARQLNEAV
jgi:hypothetical protein